MTRPLRVLDALPAIALLVTLAFVSRPVPSLPTAAAPEVLIDVNSASAAELELLPRIGPTLAERIVEHRESNGPFETLDDLDDVFGIGPHTVLAVSPHAEIKR